MADKKPTEVFEEEEDLVLGGEIAALYSDEDKLSGTIADAKEVQGVLTESGRVIGKNAIEGVTGATLTVRVGQDGADGKDGFSPTITVEEDTKTTYILRITDINGSYLTPNLYPDLEGLQDIESLVAGKVDEDLKEYPALNVNSLSMEQRKGSYLYVNSMGINGKIPLSDVALQEETVDRIKTKLQTSEDIPEQSKWRKGDYVFKDYVPIDEE